MAHSAVPEGLPNVDNNAQLTTQKPGLPDYANPTTATTSNPAATATSSIESSSKSAENAQDNSSSANTKRSKISPAQNKSEAVVKSKGDAVDSSVAPNRPATKKVEPEIPKCLTDGSNDPIPNNYIASWKVDDTNIEQGELEVEYTIKRLRGLPLEELIMNAVQYEKEFYLITRGMYRVHNPRSANRMRILRTCLKNGLTSFIKSLWEQLIKEFDKKLREYTPAIQPCDLWVTAKKDCPYLLCSCSNVYFMLTVMWNGTDMNEQDIQQQVYTELFDFCLKYLESDYLYPLLVAETGPVYKLVRAFMGTIHNLCHNYSTKLQDMRLKGAFRIIGKYKGTGGSNLRAKVMMVLSYVITEQDDVETISMEEKDISFLIKVLDNALESPNYYAGSFGYHAEEIVQGLSNIAVVESNKHTLVRAGVLPLLVKGMKSDSSSLQANSANCIWTLAFDDASKQAIINEPDCVKVLESLLKSDESKVREAANGALWTLIGKSKHLEELSSQQSKNGRSSKMEHIMISYQWDVKDEVLNLREKLRQAGYRVWIDIEQMRGSTLDSMATAVENASILVPVLTEKYKSSSSCRSEAEYAYNLQKKMVPVRLQPKYRPDGWLGFMLGSTFFYDLTKPNEYESKIKDFIAALGPAAKLKPGEEDIPVIRAGPTMDVVHASDPSAQMSLLSSNQNLPAKNPASLSAHSCRCFGWNKQQVAEWLKSNALEKHASSLEELDGRLLSELVLLKINSPDVYYSVVRDELGLKFMDLLKLNAAIQDLV